MKKMIVEQQLTVMVIKAYVVTLQFFRWPLEGSASLQLYSNKVEMQNGVYRARNAQSVFHIICDCSYY